MQQIQILKTQKIATGKIWLLIVDLCSQFTLVCTYFHELGWTLPPPFVFPPTFLPLPLSLPFHKTPSQDTWPGHILGCGAGWYWLVWYEQYSCDMNNPPTELLLHQSTRRHAFDDFSNISFDRTFTIWCRMALIGVIMKIIPLQNYFCNILGGRWLI